MAETSPAQQQYPNLNPYANSNGNGSVSSAKDTVVNSKVRWQKCKCRFGGLLGWQQGIGEEHLANISVSCRHVKMHSIPAATSCSNP